jgi:hypothetical protein
LVTTGTAPGAITGGGGVNGSNGRKGIDIIGRNTFTQPRTQVVDLRISKRFPITERVKLELLGEGFNLFNHVNITGINNTAYSVKTSGTINNGTITCGSLTPAAPNPPCLSYSNSFGTPFAANSNFAYTTRQVQIGARLFF